MKETAIATGDQLTNALHALGINFIMGGTDKRETRYQHPKQLIIALAESNEARLRLSLIPLFLEHPEFAEYAPQAANTLSPLAKLTLHCYYTAAIYIAQKNNLQHQALLDYFSQTLGLQISNDPQSNLESLAHMHKELSGRAINWLGTYQHAEQVWKTGREYRKAK